MSKEPEVVVLTVDEFNDELQFAMNKACRKTAEEILNKVYTLVTRKDTINLATRIEEIAKHYGVEINYGGVIWK